ncbi:mechanosensitive ion channel family protein [Ruegeria lacuscaerulensis ITI-1157]|nr:mechanosensitive ion channel family protein [Ruegeria lacuscaerulensis ITI-1157]SHI62922.1 Small-conductance mechanosensitive channel [Ruegeria lacuscaerulensis ITI-1157]
MRPFRILAVGFVVLCAMVSVALAQLTDRQSEFYKNWLSTAERAESVIEANRASNAALEKLRSEIDSYREYFNKARSANTDRIQTLENQIKALGPKPEDGSEEPEEIAELRNHLESQLNSLRVPRIIAEEAFNRANGLIAEIDAIIRARQRKELLARGPSPLNPAHWGPAWADMSEAGRSLINETVANMRSDVARERLQESGLAIFILVATASVLLVFGRSWSEKAGDYLRRFGGSGRGVWTFVISLFRIILPWFGVVLLVQAVVMTGVLGLRGSLLVQQIPYWAAIVLFYDWIGRQIYMMGEARDFKGFSARTITELRVYIDLLAAMLILHELAKLFERIENISDATRAVVSFPVVVGTALLLLRVRQLRSADTGENDADTEPAGGRGFSQLIELLRRGLFILGIVGPVLAAVGYTNAAEAIVFPAVKTLVLIAALVIFQRFIASVYGWLTGQGDAAGDSLFSVMVGFALAILSLPILALFWGARETDLREAWTRLLLGFDIGGVTISPSNFLTFVFVFAVGYMLTRLLQSGLRNSLLPKTNIDPGGQNAIVAGTGYVGIFLAALVAIMVAGFDLSSLAIVAGALSVGIGFGLQTIVSNFVSGIILLVERPISKGDWIDVNGMMGYVRDISVRSTRIETFDRTDVIVPNSDLISGVVTNYTRGNTIGRVIVPVGVAYGTDTKKVEQILRDIANAHPMVLANPAPNIVFQGFGADSLDFEIRAILRDVNWVVTVKSEINHEINRRFAEEGIEIPFAQRDLWLRNPEVLTQLMNKADEPSPDDSGRGEVRQTSESDPARMTEGDLDGSEGDEV